MNVYSVYDKKAMFHVSQFFAKSDVEAVRTIARAANDSRSDLNMFPNDFALYRLGNIDCDNGSISGITPVKFVVEISSLVKLEPDKQSE